MSETMPGARGPREVIEYTDPAAQETSASSAHADEHAAQRASKSFQDATIGFFTGVGRRAWAYADTHPHTVLYGSIGLVLAVLILWIGLWRTIVIALFVGIGAALGQARDRRGAIYSFFNRLFGGGR